MNKLIFGLGAAGLICVAGCKVELAQGQTGQVESYWNTRIAQSFPNHRTARVVSPAMKDRYSPKYQPVQTPEGVTDAAGGFQAPAPADDPVDALDSAAGDNELVVGEETVEVETIVDAAATPAADAATAPAPEPPDPTGSEIYEVKAGDSLGAIAQRFYGDSRRADLIIRANSDLIRDPNRIRPGMKLMIPKL